MTIRERLAAYIRTAVPALVGAGIAYLVGKIPAVADIIAAINKELETAGFAGWTVQLILAAVATAAAITAYYWVARKLGAKFPALEKWLLGSSLVPVYSTGTILIVGQDTGIVDDTRGINE